MNFFSTNQPTLYLLCNPLKTVIIIIIFNIIIIIIIYLDLNLHLHCSSYPPKYIASRYMVRKKQVVNSQEGRGSSGAKGTG